MTNQISNETTDIHWFYQFYTNHKTIKISEGAKNSIAYARKFLEEKIKSAPQPIYGINTGFGSLCKEEISPGDLEQLQVNLVRSHACGVGPEIHPDIARLIFLLKIKNFLSGHSGVSPELADRMVLLYNAGVCPVIFEKGSLGASGDLVPLAHLSLMLLGEGDVWYQHEKISALKMHQQLGIEPIRLRAKEGLALLNGTQFMLAFGLDAIWRSQKLIRSAVAICALASDAFDGRTDSLFAGLHQIRPHKGQNWVAQTMRQLLKDSPMANRPKNQVQDPYSIRCLPQVLGASKDTIDYVAAILETELNSITDNPTVFPEDDLVLSGGNFHGQPLALALDFLGIAMAEVANISERLLYKLLGGERELPVFLTKNPGLESGFMIPQYAAAALVSENKQLATPASVDSIVSSNGQEDHVSMGANAATKCSRIVDNVESVLGILLLAATQALEFRRPLLSSPELEQLYSDFRKIVEFRSHDTVFKTDMDKATAFVKNLSFDF